MPAVGRSARLEREVRMTATDLDPGAARLRERLASPEGAASLVRLGFDFLLDQPLSRFLSGEAVLAHLERAAASPRLEELLRAHLRPALDRALARAERHGEALGAALPEDARALAERLLARPVRLSPRLVEGALQQPAVRRLVRAVVVESVHRFVQDLAAGGDGLLGKLGLASGLLGRLGERIEGKLQAAAAAFVQGSLDRVTRGLLPVLSSPEMAQEMGALRVEALRAALALDERELWRALLAEPVDELLAAAPGVLRHNVGRESIRTGVREEVAAALAQEGAKRLRDVVGDPALVQAWAEEAVRLGGPLLQDLARHPAFTAWLAGACLGEDARIP